MQERTRHDQLRSSSPERGPRPGEGAQPARTVSGRGNGRHPRHRRLPRQAALRRHAGADRRRGRRRRADLRHPEAPRPPPALRSAPADGRHAEELGGAGGAVPRSQGAALRQAGGGPPARLRQLRGPHSGRQLRRRHGDRLGPRHLGHPGRAGGGPGRGRDQVPPRRREAGRRLDAEAPAGRSDQLAADQGARPRRPARWPSTTCWSEQPNSVVTGRPVDEAPPPPRKPAPRKAAAKIAGAVAAPMPARWKPQLAAAGRRPAARRRLAARDQVRRLSHAGVLRGRQGAADHPQRPRLDRTLPRAGQGVREAAVQERHPRRRGGGAGPARRHLAGPAGAALYPRATAIR